MKTMTVNGLKKWARENKDLALAVVTTQAIAQMERERVDAYVEPIFARYGFTDEDDGTPILKSKDVYRAGDEERVKKFFAECLRAHAAHGWTGDPEHCPALVAEDLQIKAEQALLDSLSEFMGVASCWTTLESREKALKLALGSCLADVDAKTAAAEAIARIRGES